MGLLSLIVRISADATSALVGIKKVEGAVKNLSHEVGSSLKTSLVEAFGEFALVEYIKKTIELSSHLKNLSEQTDVSTDSLQEWGYAAKLNGSNIDEVVGFFEKLGEARSKALSGNADAIASYKRLGVTIGDLKKKRLEDIGLQVGKTVQNGDVQNLMGALRNVGGKGIGALVPTLKSDLAAMAKAAHDAGAVIDKNTILKLGDLADEIDILGMRLRGPFSEAIIFVMKTLNMAALEIRAVGAYFRQATGQAATPGGKVMAAMGAMMPSQILLKALFPKKDASGKPEDQFADYNKVFKEAAEQSVRDDEELARRAALRRQKKEDATGITTQHAEKMSVNAREQIGAYIGGANPMLQAAQKSESHLAKIRQLMEQGKSPMKTTHKESIYE